MQPRHLDALGVDYEVKVVSAHRTPDLLFEYADTAAERGLQVIIAGAGGAAHLPGMAASKTRLPVLGVPVQSKALNGMDSLLSIAQMPAGIPVGCMAIGRAGAVNAALLAAAMLANHDEAVAKALDWHSARTRPKRFWLTATRLSRTMRIGIIGAGQLGQMLGYAAHDLDLECRFIDPSEAPPAARCGKVIQSSFADPVALIALAETCDVITYEFENVPVDALRHIAGIAPVYPPADALRYSQDRLQEKRLFDELEIPLPGYFAIDGREDLDTAEKQLGLPMVIKTRRFGYDGKGQFVVRSEDDLDAAWEALGGQPLIAEQWVAFDYEVSCIGVRSVSGEIAIYPLSQNVHVDGILRTSTSPVDDPA